MPRYNAVVTFTIQVRADYAVRTALEQSAREAIEQAAKEDAAMIERVVERELQHEDLNTDAYDVQEAKFEIEQWEEHDDAN